MDTYAISRIVELERAVNKLKIAATLVTPTTYTIEWIRDQLEADASFAAWIVTMLETDPAFYTWIVSSLEADTSFAAWIVTMLESDAGFYTWFRDALNVDSTFIESLITSFEGDLGFNNWVLSTATYSTESFITLTRTATQTFTGGVQTNIVWQSVLRNSNNGTNFQNPFAYTPPAANIVIPQSGYYAISFSGYGDVVSTKRFFLAVNGQPFVINVNDNQASSRYMYFNIVNYFDTGDTIAISLTASVTTILAVNAEKGTQQSPILHIVRVNAAG